MRLAVVPLLAGAGLVAPAAPAPAAPQVTTSGTELYVSGTNCAPGGDGSADAPFCTISAAAAVAGPGQTVLVQPGVYPESVTFTRSGTETAPVTFRAVNLPDGMVKVGRYNSAEVAGSILSLTQVHDVVVDGFTVYGDNRSTAAPVMIDGSSRVTLDGAAVHHLAPVGVRVTGTSRDVTISRNWLRGLTKVALAVDAGATGTKIVANQVPAGRIAVTDAPDTTITNNTVVAACGRGIDVTGASTGTVIGNNIVSKVAGTTGCTLPVPDGLIAVSAGSVPQTVVDYNLTDPTTGAAPYVWAGTTHATLGDFRTATGQGGHDLAAAPLLDLQQGGDRGYLPLKADSPAVDSASATVRGVPATDMLGNPHLDDPAAPNTGTGYHDRGAVERSNGATLSNEPFHRTIGLGPLDATIRGGNKFQWTADGSGGAFAYKFSDARFWTVRPVLNENHRFRRAGRACVTVVHNTNGFRSSDGNTSGSPSCTVLGAHYTAVSPNRLLDTRAALGVPTTTPVPANTDVVLTVPSIGGVQAADISAVVLNVTVTQPTVGGFLTVYPDGTSLPNASNVNFVAQETVPNLVTVPMTNGRIRFRNGSSGTVHLIADLQGWYGAPGDGFAALSPQRVLDTRAAGVGAFPPSTTRQLDLAGRIPAAASAVVLNVTVTGSTAAGVLKVFPAGSAVPGTSNLNFLTGQTIPNLVMVPVVDGKLSIHNQSTGQTHVIVDLAGYFGSDGQLSYVPNGPLRIADTRTDPNRAGHPLLSRETYNAYPSVVQSSCNCVTAAAVVANLTVTAPTAGGVLIAHPGAEARPTASNVNFVAGETASNLAVVKANGGLSLYNSSLGTTHVIVDQAGIFITPQY